MSFVAILEGRMTADGSYVASAKDPEAVHDNWLEGVDSKKVMKQAREAKKKRDGLLLPLAFNVHVRCIAN